MFLIKKYIHNKCQETQSYKEMYLSKKKKKSYKEMPCTCTKCSNKQGFLNQSIIYRISNTSIKETCITYNLEKENNANLTVVNNEVTSQGRKELLQTNKRLKNMQPFLPQETQSYKRNAMCMHKMLHLTGVPAPINYQS
jgi:hypothetical protein